MAKKIWGRPLHPTKLPIAGGFTAGGIVLGAAILYYRRRHARGIEIKLAEDIVGSVIHDLNSAEAAHLLLLMSTDYRASLENIFTGKFDMDPDEYERGRQRFLHEQTRLKALKAVTPRWHVHHHLSHWFHRRGMI